MRVVPVAALVVVMMMASTSASACGTYHLEYMAQGLPMVVPLGDTYASTLKQFCEAGPHDAPSAEFEFSELQSRLILQLQDFVSDDQVSVYGCLYDGDSLTWQDDGVGTLAKPEDDGEPGDLLQIWVPVVSVADALDLHPGSVGSAYLTCY